jgi:hypothetical protein
LKDKLKVSSAQLSSIGKLSSAQLHWKQWRCLNKCQGEELPLVTKDRRAIQNWGLKTCQFEAGFSGFICNRFLSIVNMSTWSFISQGTFIDSLLVEGYVNFLGFLLKELIILYIFLNT